VVHPCRGRRVIIVHERGSSPIRAVTGLAVHLAPDWIGFAL